MKSRAHSWSPDIRQIDLDVNRTYRDHIMFRQRYDVKYAPFNNNNNHNYINSAVIFGASHMREFTVVPLGQSCSAPGGRQLVGQAANLTFESACRLL